METSEGEARDNSTTRQSASAAPRAAGASAVSLPPGLRSLGRNAQGFEEALNEKDGTVMIRIPASTFTMGSSMDDNEKPPHSVTLAEYWMAKTPVTNAQYRLFVQATGHKSAGEWEEYARRWGDNCPVVKVSWYDAVAYCKWAGFRLPTEAEWEYAARGPKGFEYPWGNEWDRSKCCSSVGGDWRSAEKPVAAGSYLAGASSFGCLDLAGNVWEWCSSKSEPYPYDASDGREDFLSCFDSRVVRGGSWANPSANVFRGAFRGWDDPQDGEYITGFRCARCR